MRGLILAVLASLALPTVAMANAQNGIFSVMGLAAMSCGRYTADRRQAPPDQDNLAYEWVAGYLSAYNQYVDPARDVIGTPDAAALSGWLDNYCTTHPLDNLAQAAMALIRERRPAKR